MFNSQGLRMKLLGALLVGAMAPVTQLPAVEPPPLEGPQQVIADAEDLRWRSGFHKTGFDQRVYGLTEYRGDLIATGMFTRAGGTAVDLIARWDGSNWNSLGAGLVVGTRGHALATFENRLIVGGHFSNAGGLAVRNIAAWDGTSWQPMGGGFNGWVLALCVYHDTLFAGGNFTEADGTPAAGIASWNGSSWQGLSSGVSGYLARVFALAVYDDALVIAGNFKEFAGVSAENIALWDGEGARPLGEGVSSEIEELAVFGGDLVAGGWFRNAGGRPANAIAAWNGSAWRDIGGVLGYGYPGVLALAAHGETLFVGGAFSEAGGVPANNVATWDGVSWHALGSGTSTGNKYLIPTVYAIQVFGEEVFFGGEFLFAGDVYTPAMARWSESSWLPVSPGQGIPGSVISIHVYDGKVAVGGTFPWAGDERNAQRIGLWNGTDWDALDSGVDDWVTCIYEFDHELIAGGRFSHAGGIATNHIARWDGTSWRPMGEGFDGTVWELVDRGGVLYAGGDFTRSGSVELNHVAQWDGVAWLPLGPGLDQTVLSLAVHRDTLVAGGNFSFSGSTPVRFVAQWDGESWQPLGDGLNMSVRALVSFRGDLIAGGQQFGPPGTPAPLGRWNGSQWQGIYGSVDDFWDILEVNALHVLNDKLFAGGLFRSMGGTALENVARWDGTSWAGLGSGTSNTVHALSSLGGALLVGGEFDFAGGKGSAGFAIWDEIPTAVDIHDLRVSRTVSGVSLTWKSSPHAAGIAVIRVQRSLAEIGPYEDRTEAPLDPRQATGFDDRNADPGTSYWYRLLLLRQDGSSSVVGPIQIEALRLGMSGTNPILQVRQSPVGVQIHYHLELGPVPVMLGIFDVRGRHVVRLEQALLPAGDYVRIWDRRDDDGRRVPRGLYFVRLSAGGAQVSAKCSVMN